MKKLILSFCALSAVFLIEKVSCMQHEEGRPQRTPSVTWDLPPEDPKVILSGSIRDLQDEFEHLKGGFDELSACLNACFSGRLQSKPASVPSSFSTPVLGYKCRLKIPLRVALPEAEMCQLLDERGALVSQLKGRINAFSDRLNDCSSGAGDLRAKYLELAAISRDAKRLQSTLAVGIYQPRSSFNSATNEVVAAKMLEFGITIGAAQVHIDMFKRKIAELAFKPALEAGVANIAALQRMVEADD